MVNNTIENINTATSSNLFVSLRHISMFVKREMKLFFRVPHQMLITFVVSAASLILHGLSFHRAKEILEFAAPNYLTFISALLIAMVVMDTTTLLPINILRDRIRGYYKKILVYPISNVTIFIGCVIPLILKALLPICFMFFVFYFLGVHFATGIAGMLLTILIVIVGGFAFSCLGILLTLIASQEDVFFAILTFIQLPMVFLSYGYFPKSFAPEWFNIIAQYNPLTYMVRSLRSLIVDPVIHWDMLFNDILLLGIIGCVLFVVNIIFIRKRYLS